MLLLLIGKMHLLTPLPNSDSFLSGLSHHLPWDKCPVSYPAFESTFLNLHPQNKILYPSCGIPGHLWLFSNWHSKILTYFMFLEKATCSVAEADPKLMGSSHLSALPSHSWDVRHVAPRLAFADIFNYLGLILIVHPRLLTCCSLSTWVFILLQHVDIRLRLSDGGGD